MKDKNTPTLFVATVITRIFDPFLVLAAVTTVGAFFSSLSGSALWQFLAVFFFGILLPPVTLLTWAVRTKRVSSWDVGGHGERIRVLAVLGVFVLLDACLIMWFADPFLVHLFTVYLIWFAGFFGVSFFWKISGHAGVLSLAVALLVTWLGSSWWPVLLTVPLMGWSRVVRKDHSVAQVIVGSLYSFVIVYLFG